MLPPQNLEKDQAELNYWSIRLLVRWLVGGRWASWIQVDLQVCWVEISAFDLMRVWLIFG